MMAPPDLDALWDYEDPAASEARFRELLADAEAGGDSGYRAELLTQLARAQGLQRRFEQAHATLDRVDEQSLAPRARARCLLERGRVHNSSRRQDAARPLFLEAWKTALAAGEDSLAVDAAHMMGIVEPPEEQIPWTLRALELADRSPDPKARRWRASLYNNIGWSYHELGRFPEALGMFEKALAAREESGDEGKIRIAEWCVARGLRSLGRAEEALERQTALLSQCRDAGDAGGFVYEEMGECLQAMGREDEARPHFARAYDCLRKDAGPSDSQPERLARLKRLGQRE